MTHNSRFVGRNTRGTMIGDPNIHSGISLNSPSMHVGIPSTHFLTKEDIEDELSQIEKNFGMTPEHFYKSWKAGKLHGHEVMKLCCYYEFYKDEYE